MSNIKNIKADIQDPESLTDDESTAEAVIMIFMNNTDKYSLCTDKIVIVRMNRHHLITTCFYFAYIILYDSGEYKKQGGATIEQVFKGVISWEKTESFKAHVSVQKDRRKKPIYKLTRIYKVVCKEG